MLRQVQESHSALEDPSPGDIKHFEQKSSTGLRRLMFDDQQPGSKTSVRNIQEPLPKSARDYEEPRETPDPIMIINDTDMTFRPTKAKYTD